MDFGSTAKVLLRRWLVVLIGLAVTLGACAYLYRTADPSYRSDGRLLLLLPANARGDDSIGSPYLYMPSGLNVLAKIAVVTPNSRSFRADLEAQGYIAGYELGVDPTTPIIIVGVEGADPEAVLATRDRVIQAVQQELARIQQEEDVPVNQMAHARVFDAQDVPAALGGDWTRAVLAAGAAGGLLTLLAAFTVDRLMARRGPGGRRRAAGPDKIASRFLERDASPEASEEDSAPHSMLAAVGATTSLHDAE